jgi:hypothetical protein
LWERLLAGELTRVAVSCDLVERTEVFKRFIPHSLGLERVWPQAHQQDRRTGIWRTGPELDLIARELAAGDSWICGSGWPEWDVHFMEEAEAVLVFQTAARKAGMRLALPFMAVGRVLLPRRRRAGGTPEQGRAKPNRAFYSQTDRYALEQFPEKTFLINRRKYRRKLRAVRATAARPAARR